jgi:hypothetical protein
MPQSMQVSSPSYLLHYHQHEFPTDVIVEMTGLSCNGVKISILGIQQM